MKKLVYLLFAVMLVMSIANLVNQAKAEGLPESVQSQSRKDAKEAEDWKKFDKAGPVPEDGYVFP